MPVLPVNEKEIPLNEKELATAAIFFNFVFADLFLIIALIFISYRTLIKGLILGVSLQSQAVFMITSVLRYSLLHQAVSGWTLACYSLLPVIQFCCTTCDLISELIYLKRLPNHEYEPFRFPHLFLMYAGIFLAAVIVSTNHEQLEILINFYDSLAAYLQLKFTDKHKSFDRTIMIYTGFIAAHFIWRARTNYLIEVYSKLAPPLSVFKYITLVMMFLFAIYKSLKFGKIVKHRNKRRKQQTKLV